MTPLLTAIHIALDLVWIIILAQVLISWLVQFDVLNLRQRNVRQIWELVNKLTAPIYAPLSRILPPMGGLDFSPLIVLVALALLRQMIPGHGFL